MGDKSIHFAISERKVLLRLFDVVFSVLSLGLTSYFFSFDYFNYQNPNIIIWLMTFTFYFILFGEVFQLYNLQVSSNRFSVTKSLFLTTIVTTLFYFLTPYISPSLPENRIQIVYFFLAITVPVLLWRFLYMTLLYTPKYFKNILLISHSSKIENIVDLIDSNGHYNISAYLSDKEIETLSNLHCVSEAEIYDVVISKKITEIIISPIGFTKEEIVNINKKMVLLFEEGVTIKSYESFYEEITDRIPKEYLNFDFYNNINLIRNNDNKFYVLFHRLLDMIVSFIGIVILIVLLPLIFLVNLFFNKGPLFYIQERVGEKGKTFKIYKLRTMIVNAESNGAVWAIKNDKRITPFGKLLRNTRLDESPQFFNILKGDMSIIGPRPERPEFVRKLEEEIPYYGLRHVIKPGITGWAQVKYPYAGSVEEQEKKLRYDLYYIKEQSLFIDFKILIKTITTVLFFRGQ
ncbi:sugar transferase [Flavobacteriaceae bacterium S356]|uniref:Sugar transferase n=1 Tax=Asprobacillus argus TaxID=3076534 RepID=A0ABU3LDX8_9FLAO|nr:sugar transferase [Flavobacteriaceae bacterium S356]